MHNRLNVVRQRGDSGVVSLWDLLTMLRCEMPIVGVFLAAKLAKARFGSYIFAITFGLILGLGCAYTMRIVGRTVFARLRRSQKSAQESTFRVVYIVATVWIIFALLLGVWGMSAFLRYFT
jgi:hypothetical protein